MQVNTKHAIKRWTNIKATSFTHECLVERLSKIKCIVSFKKKKTMIKTDDLKKLILLTD